MNPERWRKVESIFHKALEADESRRGSVIADSCAGDEALRREVESLLAHHSDSATFMEQPASAEHITPSSVRAATAGAAPTPDLTGSAVGHYRILEEIGSGGMGQVFRSFDTRLHRTVAIKVLPATHVADPSRRKRFLQEARAASKLNHPNIVTLHDMASDGGVDYLVMEYVVGKTLKELIPSEGLPISQASGYAIQLAAALAVAHAAGLIHRDIAEGYGWVVDLDLEKFFDRVNHDKLMGQIMERVGDKRLRKLIRAFLNAGVMENGLVSPSVEGTPQGGPLSPLLSNLVLDELDRELARRGHRYVRYADDCNIYVRSERAGQRVMKSITRFIMQKLKLKVNETKSAVARPQERKFLGFSFTDGPEVQRVIAPKALDRFKRRVREITRRAKGVSIETTMAELAPYMRGWRSYFGFCETPEELVRLTRWVRLRLRVALWRQWKTPRRRRAALLALGVRPRLASNTAGSNRGPRYLAQAKALSVGLSNAYFKSLGLPTLHEEC